MQKISSQKTPRLISVEEPLNPRDGAWEAVRTQGRMLDQIDQAVVSTDLAGAITYWNPAAERMFGWSADEAVGRDLIELTSAVGPQHPHGIRSLLAKGETWSGELTMARRDGSTFPGFVVDAPLLAEDGTLIGVVGVAMDLTGQKRTENALRAHKLQLAEAQEIAGIGSWTYDLTTGERIWSDALSRIWGFAPGTNPNLEEALQRVHPDDVDRVRHFYTEAKRTRTPTHAEFRICRNGVDRVFCASVRLAQDDSGEPAQLIGVVQDITERNSTENELRRRTVQQAAVANLGQMALSGASTEFLLDQASATVSAILRVDLGEVTQRRGQEYVVVAGCGLDKTDIGRVKSNAASLTQASYTVALAQAVVVGDVASETRFTPSELLVSRGAMSGVTVPIQSADGTAWGVLGAHSRSRRGFDSSDVDFLRAVAGVIGQAMDRARADGELAARARQQSAIARMGNFLLTSVAGDVFERACSLLMYGLAADYAVFTELTPENTLRLVAGRLWADLPPEVEVTPRTQSGAAVLTGKPVVVEDYRDETRFDTGSIMVPHGILSGLMVPVTSGQRTLGVLSAQSAQVRQFRDEDVDFVQSLANMLAEAIDRDRAREALQESENRYRRIFDGATEMIFHIDAEGRFVLLNPAFETITGWSRHEWLGRHFTDLVHPDDCEYAIATFKEMLLAARPSAKAIRLIGKGREVPVEITSFPQNVDGTLIEVYGFARDVTATRRATEERERVTRSLQLVLESTVEGIYTMDMNGHCTMLNRAAAELLGRPGEALIGASMHELLHTPPPGRADAHSGGCPILQVLESGAANSVASDLFWLADGSPMPVAYSAAPIVDDGVQVGVVVTFRDLTERKKLEAKLEQAHRLSSLGRLAATVAHEFNNVLMGIAPFVEVVRRSASPEKVTTALNHIATSVKRGRRITEDILRFTQPAEPVRASVDVQACANNVASEARGMLTTRIAIDVDCDSLQIDADPNQIHQIVSNLVLNARDAMPQGGTITISARREPAGARFPFGIVDDPSRYAHLIVRDTGSGMSEETLRHAFEPLFTTKKNGTGLGLAVTHQIVLRHGGEIFIESVLGSGTAFHLFLPLRELDETPVAIAEAAGETPAALAKLRVLLVEDDPLVAAGLIDLLEYEGFSVTLARTGTAALQAVRNELPDAVLLDVGLPDMDGTTVYAAMAVLHPDLPVIFSTGHGDRTQLEEVLALPNVSYLLKPYETEALLEALSAVTSRRS